MPVLTRTHMPTRNKLSGTDAKQKEARLKAQRSGKAGRIAGKGKAARSNKATGGKLAR